MADGQAHGPGFPDAVDPFPGFHHWDGADAQHNGWINLLETRIMEQIELLGGIDQVMLTVTAAREELSNAVDLDTVYPNPDARLAAVQAVCDAVSIVVPDVIQAPVAGVPADARVHHFRFSLGGELLGALHELMRLCVLREQATSGRHTTTGIDFDSVHEGIPRWKIIQNGSAGVNRNSHVNHDDYTTAFDLGEAVNPFAEDVPLPISPHVVDLRLFRDINGRYDMRSKSGGAHYIENFRDEPGPLVVPADAPALQNQFQGPGPMPRLNAFFRHTDQYYTNLPWAMLVMQVRSCFAFPISVT